MKNQHITDVPFFHNYCLIHRRASIIISVTLLLLFALALRLHHLDYESLWMDELRQISYYPHSFVQIVHEAASQQQPPLDYWIGHFVYAFSYSDFAVRLPSALFGVGTVFFLTFLVARICSWPVGLGTGIIASLLPFNLYYSQEARPYSIAIFFMLGVLWSLDSLLTTRNKHLVKLMVLLFFSTAFLYSRTLSPLVVTVVLILILVIWFGTLILREGITLKAQQGRIILAAIVFGLALLLYFPSLYLVLAKGGRYADTSLQIDMYKFITCIRNFDIIPIWRAFIVQTEPLTFPLLILLCLSPYFAWRMGLWSKNSLLMISIILLPGASILDLFVFQTKSQLPFRPPYAIFLLPLTLVLAAVTFQGLWSKEARYTQGSMAIRVLLLGIAGVLMFNTANSALAFKSLRKKTDWRGVSAYLTASCGSKQAIICDSLSPYSKWEPTFCGFPRYYHGQSPRTSMARLPFLAAGMYNVHYEPFVLLFQWREYYLTPHSQYPIMSVPAPHMKNIDYGKIRREPLLAVTEFTGFSVIKLKKSTNNLAMDTYAIISRMLLYLPQDSSLVELQLAAASLARILGYPHWQNHLVQATKLVNDYNRSKVKNIGAHIKALTPKPLAKITS
ncbi:hypothetical protein DRO91_10210 [Candidatus Heimdallarchaeota archaeon]|nr:MAG: hypothetical protein DRO91_10210 [Candidatus Heimdallarchaeota archaeon]